MQSVFISLAILVLAIAASIPVVRKLFKRITVLEYERGLKYSKGKFTEVLQPGQYWMFTYYTSIDKVDIRPRYVPVPGQEVLSSDGVTLKVSLAAKYEVADPDTCINRVEDYEGALYLELQLALREIVGTATIDEVLEKRPAFAGRLLELTKEKVQKLGLNLLDVNVKDIMFPGPLKEMFAQIVNARKEGQAALERARGEAAALRSLANAAKMLESNPALMQLRLIQAIGGSSGNTVVLGAPSEMAPLPVRRQGEETAM